MRRLSSYRDVMNVTFVSVHVRRTDYAHHLSVLYNMTFVEDKYFNQTIELCRKRYKVNSFIPGIVFTNDLMQT